MRTNPPPNPVAQVWNSVEVVDGSGDIVARYPSDAATVYSAYGGKGSLDDLGAMLASHTHHNHPIGTELKRQIVLYADELKEVNVFKRSTDPTKFAERVCVDVLS